MKLKLLSISLAVCALFACKPVENQNPDNDNENKEEEEKPQPEEPSDEIKLLPDYKLVGTVPVIRINTDNNAEITSKEEYVYGDIRFEDPDGMYSDVPLVSGRTRIRGRGNTTWYYSKKPYRIKLDSKASIFGMNEEKDWDLLAEYTDGSLIRNIVSMQVSRIVGMPWTPECRTAEVYLNGKYLGVYTLFEHKEVGKKKINISPAEPSEVDGGYLFEIDDKFDEDVRFQTDVFYKVVKFKDPDAPTDAQYNFLKELVTNIESTIQKENFSQDSGYPSLIDVDSFINYYICEELIKNCDGNIRLSCLMARDKGEKVRIAMIWDCDLSLGHGDFAQYGLQNGSYKDWFIKDFGGRPFGWEDPCGQKAYYQYLFNDPAFVQKVKDRWSEVKPVLLSVPDYIDALVPYYKAVMEKEYAAWPECRSGKWEDSVKEVKNFYINRLNWIDENIYKL
ncbi:MAG: CotH kinase family protein [Candidatus Cryptobacteroides sp.]